MNLPLAGFTTHSLNNAPNSDGALAYEVFPGLMDGSLQRSIQAEFRRQITIGLSPLAAYEELLDFAQGADECVDAFDLLITNAGIAMSAPCEDYIQIFEHIDAIFEAKDYENFSIFRDTTRWIFESNPLNPYLAFKQAPMDLWHRMGLAMELFQGDKHIRMAVIFDDVEMMEKAKSYMVVGFHSALACHLASVPFDPLSRIRAWVDSPEGISMTEIEARIAIQNNAITDKPNFKMPQGLTACRPDIVQLTRFQPGLFSLDELAIDSADHLLRFLPRYDEFLRRNPSALDQCLKSSMAFKGDGSLLPHFIKDLARAGVALPEIYHLHVYQKSFGEYLDLSENTEYFEESFILELLTASCLTDSKMVAKNKAAMVTILGLVDPAVLDRWAKDDQQLRSAYIGTQDPRYLDRMSEAGVEHQLGSDLGL